MAKTAFNTAYQNWFAAYNTARKAQKKRLGAKLKDFPPPPTHPDEVAEIVQKLGQSHVTKTLGIHRTTLSRWLSGDSVIPRPAWLLLVMMADGVLPGMSDDWKNFRFDGDRLHIIGTRHSYSALEIMGWQYQQAHAAALARRVCELEGKLRVLIERGAARIEAANDAICA